MVYGAVCIGFLHLLTTRRNMALAVECDVKQQINLKDCMEISFWQDKIVLQDNIIFSLFRVCTKINLLFHNILFQ